MAIDERFPFGLRNLTLYKITDTTPTYAAGVDVDAAQTFSTEATVTEAILRGDDVRQSHHAFVDGAEWSVTHGGFDARVFEVILGATASDSDSTPNEVTYTDVKAAVEPPYFGMIAQIMDADDAGDLHIQVFKCKTNSPGPGEWSDGNYHIHTFAGVALPSDYDSDTIIRFLAHETAIAASGTWPGTVPYTSS